MNRVPPLNYRYGHLTEESEGWSVSQKEAIRKQLQHYHHMMRHSVEAYKLEQRVATHYEDDCIRKIEAITKRSEQ